MKAAEVTRVAPEAAEASVVQSQTFMVKARPDYRKKRGKFFTPADIANFIVRWAVKAPSDRVLDPSCGKGVFLSAASDWLLELGAGLESVSAQVYGVDILQSHAQKSAAIVTQRLGGLSPKVLVEDFFSAAQGSLREERFDAIVGNPPFIRFQRFNGGTRESAAALFETAGIKSNKLMNAWVPFVVGAASLAKEGGRLGLVLPAELLQVSHAESIRAFLTQKFGFCHLIAFPQLQFDDALVDIVILLVQKGTRPGLNVVEVQRPSELMPTNYPYEGVRSQLDSSEGSEKWIQYLLSSEQRALFKRLSGLPGVQRIKDFAQVDIGVVTGANGFFLLSEGKAKSLGVARTSVRVVCRTRDLPGTKFKSGDWKTNASKSHPVYLFGPDGRSLRRKEVRDYIRDGESAGVQLGWKCSIREPWFRTPSIWVPDALLFRQIWTFPRIVANTTGAVPTDTIHRVRIKPGISLLDLVASFHNSLTATAAEIHGRSYGGGVLEIQPTEAESLPLPLVSGSRKLLHDIDSIVREGLMERAVSMVDDYVLHENLGIPRQDIVELRLIRSRLFKRRATRHKSRPGS